MTPDHPDFAAALCVARRSSAEQIPAGASAERTSTGTSAAGAAPITVHRRQMMNGADPGDRPVARVPRRSRRRLEKLLAKAQERLALISSMTSLGFWRWNRATDEVWASKHARSILGFDASAPLTRDMLLMAIHPVDRASIVRTISATAHQTDRGEMELRVMGGQGRELRWITAKASAYRDANGMLLRVVGYVIDDSQRKRAEAESLKQQQQITHLTRVAMLGELSGALAHELQQPLTAILCNAQAAQLLAAKAHVNVEELREILIDIVSEDKHAGQIIQHLRSLLMRGELHLQRVELADLVRDVLRLARGTLVERNVQVDLTIDDGVSAVLGDRVELQQVLLNLILNACEAMSANAAGDRRIEIIVALDAEQGAVRTSVLDCGKGINREQLDHVFEPFLTTKKSGLGLGLAVCDSIIVAHQGRLWANNNPNRGAAFHFTLPLST
jgi:C4-dicarboxylate-specific signal transduction histidine kinase